MNCYIHVDDTDKCVACKKSLTKDSNPVSILMQDSSSYRITYMCQSCMKTYKNQKKELVEV